MRKSVIRAMTFGIIFSVSGLAMTIVGGVFSNRGSNYEPTRTSSSSSQDSYRTISLGTSYRVSGYNTETFSLSTNKNTTYYLDADGGVNVSVYTSKSQLLKSSYGVQEMSFNSQSYSSLLITITNTKSGFVTFSVYR